MKKIIEKLDICGKVSEVHAQEIEEIIQGLITKSFEDGFRSGKLHHKKHIDKQIEKMNKCNCGTLLKRLC